MTDSQDQFEAWAKKSSMNITQDSEGEYINLAVHGAWSAWRAALSRIDYVHWKSAAESRQPIVTEYRDGTVEVDYPAESGQEPCKHGIPYGQPCDNCGEMIGFADDRGQ